MKDPGSRARYPHVTTTRAAGVGDPESTGSILLDRLRDLDSSAWTKFWSQYQDFVRRVASRRGLAKHEIDEVAQEVLQRVSEKVHCLEPRPRRGAFRRWLTNLTLWRSADRLRRRFRESARFAPLPEGSSVVVDAALLSVTTPETEIDEGDRLALVRLALVRLQRRFRPITLQMFGLHVLDGLDAKRVAAFLGVATSRVYIAKHRVAPFLRREIRTMLEEARFRGQPRHQGHGP